MAMAAAEEEENVDPKSIGASHHSSNGVLAGRRYQPRKIAGFAHDAGFRDKDLFTCIAVCGSESWFFERAHNDNQIKISECDVNQEVMNPELGQHMIVLNPTTGRVKLLPDDTIENHPPDSIVTVSRDVGLMEINIPASQIGTPAEEALYAPAANFKAAFALWKNRGWQPWVGFNKDIYLHDTYISWALLGAMNYFGEQYITAATDLGQTPQVKIPAISLKQYKRFYPDIVLG